MPVYKTIFYSTILFNCLFFVFETLVLLLGYNPSLPWRFIALTLGIFCLALLVTVGILGAFPHKQQSSYTRIMYGRGISFLLC
uniref:Uncharacterized protein n=1 Tax=Pelusios castaneus TaxID=367368 RepID=A0A8C8VK93_9SAUR